jgi:hypothetical protein
MQTNSDFVAMLPCFAAREGRFLVVGAYAVVTYARPRATGDMDLWVARDAENARRIDAALAAFGAPLHDIDDASPSIRRRATVYDGAVRRSARA